ncbi:Udp-glycosyltransferase 84a1 [Thalictrum thalictroides]|uniref:Glycosyltransferase n=1 Tax=Thalictrum thalictroides TaxID=46969 RepID=A0A7J6W6V7_THATH|nr:Udp-glycosyltransferase 84a1 [Thalictrum thalictroides]
MGSETTSSLHPHVLMVSFPARGHINPLLRLAKCLASKGLYITFSTNHNVRQMFDDIDIDTSIKIGHGELRFEFFSDGSPLHEPIRRPLGERMNQLETAGPGSLVQLINKQTEAGRPVSCIINNMFVPWVCDVAAEMGIPFAVLWIESCAIYSIYYHYFHELASFPTVEQPDSVLDIPGLPTLQPDEITTLLHPLHTIRAKPMKKAIMDQIKNLSKSFAVLVDSFDELEHEAIEPMLSLCPIRPIGPLCKFHDVGGTLSAADECIEWLDTKPPGSVVYVSFGTLAAPTTDEMEEIAWGLYNSGLSFIWVVKPNTEHLSDKFIKESEGMHLLVHWCPQDRVLAHPSVACFVTHCGWNSCMESLSSGVPVVAAPQFGDQVTNAKFLVDVYGVGVQLIHGIKDMKTLTREMVEKCVVEVTRGSKAEEIKKNALNWRKTAEETVVKGGSSEKNIQKFVDEILLITSK